MLLMGALVQLASAQAPPFATRSQSGPLPAPPIMQANQRTGANQAIGQPMAPLGPAGQSAVGSLSAQVNCNRIRDHVTLTPNLQTGGSTISTSITSGPPGEIYQWSIHQFPVKPGAAMCSCSPLILGNKLVDLSELHGNLPSASAAGEQPNAGGPDSLGPAGQPAANSRQQQQQQQQQRQQQPNGAGPAAAATTTTVGDFQVHSATLNLFGPDSPVGHSLLLRGLKTGVLACATFLPTSRKSNYRAKFHSPLSGSVTVFQTAFGTTFLSHLMYSNGTRRHSAHRFDLLRSNEDLLTSQLHSGSSVGQTPALVPGAQMALEQREHDNVLSACRLGLKTLEPLFGGGRNQSSASTQQQLQLSVSTENFGMRGRTALVLPPLPLETFASVYVAIYSEFDSREPIACAPLRFVKPKTAAAKFQTGSVQGSVLLSQDSPFDVTLARVNLNFPNSDGHSYGIDELPMIIRRESDTRVCPNIREIIYNPHHIEPSSVPPEGEATSDQYAVGDLSGKYGSLTGKAQEKIQALDFNLPLFGPVSVVGRALTVYSSEGVAIACSNIELTQPMRTAFATFDFGLQGQFIFRQPLGDCNGDTYVYIEVSKPTGSGGAQERSLDHNWHIHTSPVDSGLEHLSSTECSAAGGHFNPYNTSTGSIYSRDCTPFNVLRCELGDLSAKMFTIEIPPYRVKASGQEPDIGKFFGTDIDLPLCGPVSIVNRSVVVHVADFGPQRMACSTVIEFKPRSSN